MKVSSFTLLLLGITGALPTLAQVKPDTVRTDTLQTDSIHNSPQTTAAKTISIVGVGDIMVGTNFPSKAYLPPGDDAYALLEQTTHWLQDADLTVGNLEGCFSDTAPLVKRCQDSTKCYAFRMPVRYGSALQQAGFDVLTIANNHSGDFGDLGRQTTVDVLESLGIYHAGWQKYPFTFFEHQGVKYGVASFAPNKGTVSIHNIKAAKQIVDSLQKVSDIVIVTFHGGAEGSKHQHVTRETETFYGENRGNVYAFAREMIDAGADVVFGHGPHVTRAIDLYKGRFIAYSLGNFCTYGRFNLSGPNGIAPIIKVQLDTAGVFLKGQIYSAEQLGRGGAYPDKENRAVKILQTLTRQDIPECPLEIKDDGAILLKP